MTEQTAETPDTIQVRMEAIFRSPGHQHTVAFTLGDPAKPYILFTFASAPDGVLQMMMDVTGFDPGEVLDFLEVTIQKMRTVQSERILPDGTRVPYSLGDQIPEAEPETADSNKSPSQE